MLDLNEAFKQDIPEKLSDIEKMAAYHVATHLWGHYLPRTPTDWMLFIDHNEALIRFSIPLVMEVNQARAAERLIREEVEGLKSSLRWERERVAKLLAQTEKNKVAV